MASSIERVTRSVPVPLVLLILLAIPAAGMAAAPIDAARNRRASVPHHGGQSNLFAFSPSMSADGQVVAWDSFGSDFVSGDTNDVDDVFVRDLRTGKTVRISVSTSGAEQDDSSSGPAVSGDGRYVTFSSFGRSLVAGDTNRSRDVFIHDLTSGRTERVSLTSTGDEANENSVTSDVSHDGRFVAFQSYASNLVEEDANLFPDIYVRDRVKNTTEVVSVDSSGSVGDGGSLYFDLSSDGRYVAFSSSAEDLVPGDTNTQQDVFVHDRETGDTEIVSISTEGASGNLDSRLPSISDDGRFVAFESASSTLVPQDANAASDIFVRDRELDTTRRVSITSQGSEAASGGTPYTPGSFFASISPDGRFVAYQSDAPNLMPDDTTRDWDVFVHDLVTGSTTVGLRGLDGSVPDFGAGQPEIGGDGRFIAVLSRSTNLVAEGNDQWHDVFVHDRGPSVGIGGVAGNVAGSVIEAEGWASFAGDRLATVADPGGDADMPAQATGSDLTGFSLSVRPALADLFVRWEVSNLPAITSNLAGSPAVVHVAHLEVDGVPYELRAARAGVPGVPPRLPAFGLYRCDTVCTEVQALAGGYGESGTEITASVPLDALGLAGGDVIAGLTVSAGLGEMAAGVLQTLDELEVGDVVVPAIEVALGLAPLGSDRDAVTFTDVVSFADGRFAGRLAIGDLPPGRYDLWARGCHGQRCGVERTSVDL